MRPIRVTFDNGDVLETCVNASVPKADVAAYYLNSNPQDYDLSHPDRLRKPVKVEFLD